MMQTPLLDKLDIQKTKERKGDASNQPARTEKRKTNGWMVMRVCGRRVSMLPGQYGGDWQPDKAVLLLWSPLHTHIHTNTHPSQTSPMSARRRQADLLDSPPLGTPPPLLQLSPIHPSLLLFPAFPRGQRRGNDPHQHPHTHTVVQAHLHPSQDIEPQNTGTRNSTALIIQSIIKMIHTDKNDASTWNQHSVFAYLEICLYNPRCVSIMLLAACQFFLYSNSYPVTTENTKWIFIIIVIVYLTF